MLADVELEALNVGAEGLDVFGCQSVAAFIAGILTEVEDLEFVEFLEGECVVVVGDVVHA